MLYRKMKKADRELSILGFGAMRLPVDGDGRIDEAAATGLIRYAIDNGVNYVDTAYPYHNGESEPFLGRALKDGYREKVNLATKLPVWRINKREDMDKCLNEQLKRLGTDHIDFYLLHSLNRKRWRDMKKLGFDRFLDSAVSDGRISYAGFSFHDDAGIFKEIVDAYDWTLCQIQYNFMDENYQAGTEGLDHAVKNGLGVAVMEPLRGGMLAKNIPAAADLLSEVNKSMAELGLRWIWEHPGVTVVLSGMCDIVQVRENLRAADNGIPGSLSGKDIDAIEKIKTIFRNRMKVDCTNCRYCMPCPNMVNIPECFARYNNAFMFEDTDNAKFGYDMFLGLEGHASQCMECGQCENVCPQNIPIQEKLKEVASLFGK